MRSRKRVVTDSSTVLSFLLIERLVTELKKDELRSLSSTIVCCFGSEIGGFFSLFSLIVIVLEWDALYLCKKVFDISTVTH